MRHITKYDVEVALKCKTIRKALVPKVTQHDIARRMGTTQSPVAQMERAQLAPTHSFICAVADAAGLKPIDLDPNFNNPRRFGPDRIDFAARDHLYVLFNETIGWSKVGISGDPVKRCKTLSSRAGSPGLWQVVCSYQLSSAARGMECELIGELQKAGYKVDGENIQVSPTRIQELLEELLGIEGSSQ